MKNSTIAAGAVFCASLLIAAVSCKTSHEVKELQSNASLSHNGPDLARGKQLVSLACGVCHLDGSTQKLTGAQMLDVPGFLGKIYASNITNDPVNGIGKRYTDGQLRYLLRTGIKNDGKMAPFMQKPNLSDEDMENMIAFLRSDDPMVSSNDVNTPKTKYKFIGKMAIEGSKPLPHSANTIKTPDKNDKVAYGKYLIDIIGCYDCHSADIMKVDKVNIEKSKGFMGGGTKMLGLEGPIYTSNLTFHETGIANWTVQDFDRAVRKGINKNNKILRYPMRIFAELTDSDIEAMYAYLKTVPPINNKVKGGDDKKKD